jgi:hypothetical protein
MIQPVAPGVDDARPAVPAPRTGPPTPAEPDGFTFADVEHGLTEDPEPDLVWDGFL